MKKYASSGLVARVANPGGTRVPLLGTVILALAIGLSGIAHAYTLFESAPGRSLAISSTGDRLYATNIADGRLEIVDVSGATPVSIGSVPVGLDPVSVALRNDNEAWVVNHLSDSVSIVDLSTTPPRVVRTLLVGDQPRDIVFAGPAGDFAFITAAHRGQNNPNDPQLTTPGVARADVWVFDAANPGVAMGGEPLAILSGFADTPRALATDGSKVWFCAFHSGNKTTIVNESAVCDGGENASPCSVLGSIMPGGLPDPRTDADGVTGPEVGLIVRQIMDPEATSLGLASGGWYDELGRDWSNAIRFDLPDQDCFEIDAEVYPPALTGRSAVGVGTTLFGATLNPVSGHLYVSNTDANNDVRFEGPGTRTILPPVTANLHKARITIIDTNDLTVTPRHLNTHIDYGQVPSPAGTKNHSLATPLEMVVTADGETLYVAAFSSSKVGIFSTAELEAGTFVPSSANHITVSGGGPGSLILDESRGRLFAYTRFDQGVSQIDIDTRTETAHLSFYNPEPPSIREGRKFLYDANLTSSNGEASCASCHTFGDNDQLAWDLGNPDEHVEPNPLPLRIPAISGWKDFHPLKGPMTTQTFQGMATHGAMHWRGDRNGGPGNVFDEVAAFNAFNGAFPGLLGRSAVLSSADMQKFTDFVLQIKTPPPPIRNLDNSLTPQQQAGRNLFFGRVTDSVFSCEGCHRLDPAQGFFGTDGQGTFEAETQTMKVAHMRNVYTKVGMFGMSPSQFVAGPFDHRGPQIRGYGLLHDGSVDGSFRFFAANVFTVDDQEQRNLEAFTLAFPAETHPIVGQQVTLGPASALEVDDRIDLLLARAAFGECDVIAKAVVANYQRGAVRLPSGNFQADREGEVISAADVRALANTPGQEVTFSCVPPGDGERLGIDRDGDGHYDTDEAIAGSDPADPNSVPTPAICGNGIAEIGEDCDDGAANGGNASCCASDCSFKPNGAASCDGISCTSGDTCNAGVCTPGPCSGAACGCGGTCKVGPTGCGCGF